MRPWLERSWCGMGPSWCSIPRLGSASAIDLSFSRWGVHTPISEHYRSDRVCPPILVNNAPATGTAPQKSHTAIPSKNPQIRNRNVVLESLWFQNVVNLSARIACESARTPLRSTGILQCCRVISLIQSLGNARVRWRNDVMPPRAGIEGSTRTAWRRCRVCNDMSPTRCSQRARRLKIIRKQHRVRAPPPHGESRDNRHQETPRAVNVGVRLVETWREGRRNGERSSSDR